jgi:hypothetical protein
MMSIFFSIGTGILSKGLKRADFQVIKCLEAVTVIISNSLYYLKKQPLTINCYTTVEEFTTVNIQSCDKPPEGS